MPTLREGMEWCMGRRQLLESAKWGIFRLKERNIVRWGAGRGGLFFQRRTFQLRDMDVACE